MSINTNEETNLIDSNELDREVEVEVLSRNDTSRNCNNCSQVCNFLNKITVEPCICLYFMTLSMETVILSEFLIQKTCSVNFHYSEEVCSNITSYEEKEVLLDKKVNLLLMYNSLIQSIPPVFFVLFLGAWSDRYGRKLPLILPFFGGVLRSLLLMLNSLIWKLPSEYFLFSAVPTALTGGLTCLIMSIYSYISDISDRKSRTSRIAYLDTFLALGPTLGLLLVSAVKSKIGFTGIYIITGCMHAICILYIIIRIEETRGHNARRDLDQELVEVKPSARLKDIFSCANLRDTFRVTFEKRPNHGRAKVLLVMGAICLLVFQYSSFTKEYLYINLKFKWTMQQYIYWSATAIFFQLLGLSIIFPILSYKLGIRDEFLALIGSFTSGIYNMALAFVVRGYQLYIASMLGLLTGSTILVSRSMASKIVPEEASGKVFSVLASWESCLPLLAQPLYTFAYDRTVATFPGAIFCINVGVYVLTFVIYLIILKLSRRENISGFEVREED